MGEGVWDEDDDAGYLFETFDQEHPINVVRTFFTGLERPGQYRAALEGLVTPESQPQWGDFVQASRWLESLSDYGIGSVARHYEGAPDVRFVKIVEGITTGRFVESLNEIEPAAFVTLVWRPEVDSWLIHGIGEPIDPDRLNRTSPGIAPPV